MARGPSLMTATRAVCVMAPALAMVAAMLLLNGTHHDLQSFAASSDAKRVLARIGIAIPAVTAAAIGIILLFASARSRQIQSLAWGVLLGTIPAMSITGFQELRRLAGLAEGQAPGASIVALVDPASLVGAITQIVAGCFALRVALLGNAAFGTGAPRRVSGRRALHGEADWMGMAEAAELFGEAGGIVIGEAYRVDRDRHASHGFRANDEVSWGQGGRVPLLCFDGSFGSSHGIAFAGSGGFKTTSVVIPTALRWGGTLVVLDPSGDVAARALDYRNEMGRQTVVLDPRRPETGFNALDWIGRFGNTKEEDIASVASWIMSDNGRATGVRDDFFRSTGLQLLTAMIADVCLSGRTLEQNQTLRTVRANLAEPETKLRKRLSDIFEHSASAFVKENVAAFVNMTPETFSGVYANAIKETHWLSYENYAALVSGSAFSTDEVASGGKDVFINIDLKTLETHSGLARVIIGSLLNAIYNREGTLNSRALFLLDEVARLGYMRVLETARDAGRKYGITLLMIYQSIGQLRETYGGRDASSKWFESSSWISFAAINDPETAEYISRRCGMTTVEIDQVSRSFQTRGSSRTRSKQVTARPLILPHEVLLMRADEQIVFTAGNPPLKCGRAIWFRRRDMRYCAEAPARRLERQGRAGQLQPPDQPMPRPRT